MGNKSDNTLVILVIIGLILLLLFANGSLSFLFVSQKSKNPTYWATADFQPSSGQNLGDNANNAYVDAISQKILVPQTFTVKMIQVRIGYVQGNPSALGIFSVGLASSYSGSFLWKTTFNPNALNGGDNAVYNFTVPAITVHNSTYVRFEYSGTTNNDSIADYVEMRMGYVQASTNEGMWFHSSPTTSFPTVHWEGNVSYWILYCGVSG